jgi:hypothetical protein
MIMFCNRENVMSVRKEMIDFIDDMDCVKVTRLGFHGQLKINLCTVDIKMYHVFLKIRFKAI